MRDIHFQDAATLVNLISENFEPWSESHTITQQEIDSFAALTGDDMWMHVDVERCAKESPFKSTIAHGFLLLSMLPKFKSAPAAIDNIRGFSHMMNYGSDKLRFLGAVPVNSALHARSRINSVEVGAAKTKITIETHLHIVDQEKPALIYELAFVYL